MSEPQRPAKLYFKAVCAANDQRQNRTTDAENRATEKSMRLELRFLPGFGIPNVSPSDSGFVAYIADTDRDKWLGCSVGREYEVFLTPVLSEEEKRRFRINREKLVEPAETAAG